jgi:hypothetical protein
MNILGHRLLVVTVIGLEIGRSRAGPARSLYDSLTTQQSTAATYDFLGVAMQKNYRFALSSGQIMKSNSVDVSEPIFDSLLRMHRKHIVSAKTRIAATLYAARMSILIRDS